MNKDLIYRQDALDAIDAILPVEPMKNEYTQGITCGAALAMEYVKQLPSAQPERKRGKWVNNIYDIPICDQCGYMTPYDRAIDDYEYGNFCPNCGSDMSCIFRK